MCGVVSFESDSEILEMRDTAKTQRAFENQGLIHPRPAWLLEKDMSAQDSGEDSKILEECSGVAVGHQSESTQVLDDGYHSECSDELNLTTSATFKTGVCNFFFPLHPRRCVHLQSFQ